ncbi:hypothetical protein [uncultured Vibrio sp.]|uniref:hypothetical protein n=1 Tax=uncultured Vibrio sp. TaxID=114054 RepID=UPI0026040A94|nr:hypothetical protein [uncultured Vibrio sp.]
MISSAHNNELNRYIEGLDLNLTKAQLHELDWQQSRHDSKKHKTVFDLWFFFSFFGLCTLVDLVLLALIP